MQTTMGNFNPNAVFGNVQFKGNVDPTPGFLGLGRRPGGTRVGNFLRGIFGGEKQPGFQGLPRPTPPPPGQPGGGVKNPLPAVVNEVGNVVREHARSWVNNLLTRPPGSSTTSQQQQQQQQQQVRQIQQRINNGQRQQQTTGQLMASLPLVGIVVLLFLFFSGVNFGGTGRRARRPRRVLRATRASRGLNDRTPTRAPRAKSEGFARRIHGKLYRSPEAWGKAMKALRKK